VLIGEPGVGRRHRRGPGAAHHQREVPESLKGKRLLVLDLASLLAGAKYRGEFEERLKSVLKDLAKDAGTVHLHRRDPYAGRRRQGRGRDRRGNMLKPALARGGAATASAPPPWTSTARTSRRRRARAALSESPGGRAERRGDHRHPARPAERYELHHGVENHRPGDRRRGELSQRYITDRFLPTRRST